MNILVKFPTRSRPHKFLMTLKGYMDKQITDKVQYLITIDEDDTTMNNPLILDKLKEMPNVTYHVGTSTSKIHAINRDMHKAKHWDICVLASDDMICQWAGWDQRIITDMQENFPETFGTLYYWDGDASTRRHNDGKGLCTMCILGSRYFDAFGYIYHSSYISLWSDNEYTEVAQRMGAMYKSTDVLFKHDHHSNNNRLRPDRLMIQTQSFYTVDGENYKKREAINFGL